MSLLRPCRSVLAATIGAIVLLTATPSSAQLLKPDRQAYSEEERDFLKRLLAELSKAASIDEARTVLADYEKSSPTGRKRIMVDAMRWTTYVANDQPDEGLAMVQKTVAAHPGEALAHAVLAEAAYAANNYALAAEALIAAVKLDAQWANRLSGYDLMVLFSQLEIADKELEQVALASHLFDAGWTGGSEQLRSALAHDIVADRLENGDIDIARRYVTKIGSPVTLGKMLTQNRFSSVWPTIVDWAGKRLEKRWPAFLEDARARFDRERSAEATLEYSAALKAANHHATIAKVIHPHAISQWRSTHDEAWLLPLATSVSALAKVGRWKDAFETLDEAERLIHEKSVNRANISGNRARLKLLQGEFGEAVTLFDSVSEEVKSNRFVAPETLASIEAYRQCARFHYGHGDAMQKVKQLAATYGHVAPYAVSYAWLCLDRPDHARSAWMIASLDPEERRRLLDFLQPADMEESDSEFARTMKKRHKQLKRDRALRSGVQEIGVIRDWPVNDAAPDEKL